MPGATVAEFQAAALTPEGRARLAPARADRGPSARPRPGPATAWPRVAWYVAGLGRHASAASDAPALARLVPLHEFFAHTALDPLPPGALLTYTARMREQGWNVTPVLEVAAACGVRVPDGVAAADVEARRLPGPRRPDAVGDVVWARTAPAPGARRGEGGGGDWWPAEALDPWRMPAGRTIPPGVAAMLSDEDAALSLPGRAPARAAPPPQPTYAAGPGLPPPPPPSASGERRVLVVFVSGGARTKQPRWARPCELAPWGARRVDASAPAPGDAAAHARAAAEADATMEAKAGLAAGGGGAGGVAAAAASAAGARAFAARSAARCERCAACRGATGRDRRCLVARVAAGAEAGHFGAQLAALGDGAVGARVKSWWPLDAAWYAATIVAFDPIRQAHTIAYDDGDVETAALWAPIQVLKAATNPLAWPANAAVIAEVEARGTRRGGSVAAAAGAAVLARERAEAAAAGAGGSGSGGASATGEPVRAPPPPQLALPEPEPDTDDEAPPEAAAHCAALAGASSRSRPGARCPACAAHHRGCGTARAARGCERRGGGGRAAPPRSAGGDSGDDDAAGDAGDVGEAVLRTIPLRSGRLATRWSTKVEAGEAADAGPSAPPPPRQPPATPPRAPTPRCASCAASKKGHCGTADSFGGCERGVRAPRGTRAALSPSAAATAAGPDNVFAHNLVGALDAGLAMGAARLETLRTAAAPEAKRARAAGAGTAAGDRSADGASDTVVAVAEE